MAARITDETAILIENIFTNSCKGNSNYVSDNITTYISDHFPQFLIIENRQQQNSSIAFIDYKNFDKETFKTELCELDCSLVTENHINLGFEIILHFINRILDKHAPIKTLKKKRENKIISKP